MSNFVVSDAGASSIPAGRHLGATGLLPFLAQEYSRIMHARVAIVIWVMMAYAVLMLPFALAKPPEELVEALARWLGPANIQSKIVSFFWTDTTMNKFAMILGPILAGGIMIDEKSRGMLDLLLAKPVRVVDYFMVKLGAALLAMATFYLTASAAAAITFPFRVPDFQLAPFAALTAVHFFSALFAITFSALVAVLVRRKLASVLISFLTLSVLVGFAFIGLYYPPLREVSYLNPFTNGVMIITRFESFGAADVLVPIIVLLTMNGAVAAAGRALAPRVVDDE